MKIPWWCDAYLAVVVLVAFGSLIYQSVRGIRAQVVAMKKSHGPQWWRDPAARDWNSKRKPRRKSGGFDDVA